jgi:peptide chain release factor 2
MVQLERETIAPGFWEDRSLAQSKMKRLSGLTADVEAWSKIDEDTGSLAELVDVSIAERDDSLAETFVEELERLTETLDRREFQLSLSGRYDRGNAIAAVHAGAGGVESQDWVRMIVRMLLRWSERSDFESQVLDVSPGEEGGIKSAVLQVSGEYAYGYLRSERGVHRLVRLSPFDADHARHTSFALVEVLPQVEQGVDIEIDPADLRIEVFKAGGAGGQSVQKNSTAVRITHEPTGIRVSCQNERSQYQNKAIAMRILTARLVEREMKLRSQEVAKLKGDHISAEWGNQIRSYVLHPYKMVKDHRTGHETSDAEGVLDGGMDDFISAYLTHSIGNTNGDQ